MSHRIIFLGTPQFAVPSLAALVKAGHEVVEVVTQPDRPKGRKHELAQSPIKSFALLHGLTVFQPERARRPEAVEHLRALQPDLMVIVGYGQILPQAIIDLAPLGIINVHASLLPRLRGAAPIQWAIANGDRITGVTTMQIDAGLDTGDILLKAETLIEPADDAVTLSERLSHLGAELLVDTIARLGEIIPRKQDASEATLAPILKKDDGRIDWNHSADRIANRVRGFVPWPGAHTTFRGQLLHIWKANAASESHTLIPGTLRAGHVARIACGEGTMLDALEMQAEGRKRVSGEAFMNGLRLHDNEFFGGTLN